MSVSFCFFFKFSILRTRVLVCLSIYAFVWRLGGYYGLQNIHAILFPAGPPQYLSWLERQSATCGAATA